MSTENTNDTAATKFAQRQLGMQEPAASAPTAPIYMASLTSFIVRTARKTNIPIMQLGASYL